MGENCCVSWCYGSPKYPKMSLLNEGSSRKLTGEFVSHSSVLEDSDTNICGGGLSVECIGDDEWHDFMKRNETDSGEMLMETEDDLEMWEVLEIGHTAQESTEDPIENSDDECTIVEERTGNMGKQPVVSSSGKIQEIIELENHILVPRKSELATFISSLQTENLRLTRKLEAAYLLDRKSFHKNAILLFRFRVTHNLLNEFSKIVLDAAKKGHFESDHHQELTVIVQDLLKVANETIKENRDSLTLQRLYTLYRAKVKISPQEIKSWIEKSDDDFTIVEETTVNTGKQPAVSSSREMPDIIVLENHIAVPTKSDMATFISSLQTENFMIKRKLEAAYVSERNSLHKNAILSMRCRLVRNLLKVFSKIVLDAAKKRHLETDDHQEVTVIVQDLLKVANEIIRESQDSHILHRLCTLYRAKGTFPETALKCE